MAEVLLVKKTQNILLQTPDELRIPLGSFLLHDLPCSLFQSPFRYWDEIWYLQGPEVLPPSWIHSPPHCTEWGKERCEETKSQSSARKSARTGTNCLHTLEAGMLMELGVPLQGRHGTKDGATQRHCSNSLLKSKQI